MKKEIGKCALYGSIAGLAASVFVPSFEAEFLDTTNKLYNFGFGYFGGSLVYSLKQSLKVSDKREQGLIDEANKKANEVSTAFVVNVVPSGLAMILYTYFSN